jgi:sugar fermentation stimulation protein A
MNLKKRGYRAAMFYVIQRPDGKCFQAADYVDPVYAQTLQQAWNMGVEVFPLVVTVQPEGIFYGWELQYQPG